MEFPTKFGDRLTAIFVLGVVLFHPAVIVIFDTGAATMLFGLPLLFVYCFGVWGGVIVLLAIAIEKGGPPDRPPL